MMKLVIRADDIGYTKNYNVNLEVFEKGFATSADIMADTPGSIEAMEKMRAYPWISTGWHTHMWGTPVLDPSKVPTLYDPERGHFRKDLDAEDVSFEEALAECRAQMSLFHKHMGKAPDALTTMWKDNPFGRALSQVARENGLAMDYYNSDAWFNGNHFVEKPVSPWERKNIWMFTDPETMKGIFTDSLTEQYETYDPEDYFLNRSQGLFAFGEDAVVVQPWHPGIVDYYVMKCGDYGAAAKNFLLVRPMDLQALTSEKVMNWICEKKIELVNLRDALYGTHEYQNHLREIGSPLYVG